MVDALGLLQRLARERPLFHSEADFQHAIAWQIQLERPDAQIRLEYRPALAGRPHLDIWATAGNDRLAVELKYRTRAIDVELGGEAFSLSSHAAQDQGRYDFLKDIVRLERVASEIRSTRGIAVMLTNDSALWKASTGAAVDAAFRLEEGRLVQGHLDWGPATGPGTKKGRLEALSVVGPYTLAWGDYSVVPTARYGRFRFLLVDVRTETPARAGWPAALGMRASL